MKITFISQKPNCIIPRNHPNMRVDLAQQCILNSPNIHYSNISQTNEKFDVAILLIPKTEQDRNQLYNIDIVTESRKIAKKVWFMQEGPAWIFQDLPLHQQFWHYNVLSAVDGILCENETDINYFKGLLIDKTIPVFDIPSVMVEDQIKTFANSPKQDKVMIGGNFCIGYEDADTQRKIHPLLSVKQGDLETAKKLAIKLKNDTDFYNECSKLAVENYTTKFSEEIFLQKMNERLVSC